jgi:hypothetical protein
VGAEAGLVVPRDGDYVAAASKQVEYWINDPTAYRAASEASVRQAQYLDDQGRLQLERFTERVFAPC